MELPPPAGGYRAGSNKIEIVNFKTITGTVPTFTLNFAVTAANAAAAWVRSVLPGNMETLSPGSRSIEVNFDRTMDPSSGTIWLSGRKIGGGAWDNANRNFSISRQFNPGAYTWRGSNFLSADGERCGEFDSTFIVSDDDIPAAAETAPEPPPAPTPTPAPAPGQVYIDVPQTGAADPRALAASIVLLSCAAALIWRFGIGKRTDR
jgi:hypothetical protein